MLFKTDNLDNMSSLNYNLDKDTVVKLFKVEGKHGQLVEKYQGSLGWFFDDAENPINPPSGITGIYPTRKETYLEIHYTPTKISEDEVKEYLLGLGIETGLVEDYKMTFPKLVLKWILAPFVFLFAIIVLVILKVAGGSGYKK